MNTDNADVYFHNNGLSVSQEMSQDFLPFI